MRGCLWRRVALCLGIAVCMDSQGCVAVSAAPPNVVVILADDLGFSDLGSYGGEIDTPNLDRLAAGGLRFTQGYNTARCWPTRAALLTGYYAQAINRDALPGGRGGAQGKRPEFARLLPELLAPAGYRSYHSGKWHIDGDPRSQGFLHSLQVEGGQNDYFDPAGITVDGKPVEAGAGFYVTTAIGEHAVECLRDHAARHAGTPFFSYVAFTSPHFPLHAPQEVVAKYKERYLAGWDAVRQARFERLTTTGIVEAPLPPLEPEIGPPYQPKPEVLARFGPGELDRPRPWAGLSPEQRELQATKMAIHAAMVEMMDRAVGRIIAQLEAMHALEDTLMLFLSDNGASAEILIRGKGHDPALPLGSAGTFPCLGPGWSSCANTPFRRHKTWVHEGGIATPWIVHWPRGVADGGALRTQPVHVIDVVPTILELADVDPPAEHDGTPAPPLQGRSFAACLGDPVAPPPHETLWWCHEGHRAVRVGDWKLVALKSAPWELYDLAHDRTETANLAASEPGRVQDLAATWNRIADECRGLSADAGGAVRSGGAAASASRPRPNILYIIADDQSPFDLKCYNPASRLSAPRIERLAAEGMVFDAAYHMGSFSGAVCTPSRHMVMCGRSVWHLPIGPHTSRQQGAAAAHCPPDIAEFTLAPVFNRAGYDTMRTCKQGNAYEAADARFTVRHDATKRGGTHEGGSGWHADRVLEYLAERERTKDTDPFLIYFGFSHPHDTRNGTPELLDNYGATNHADPSALPAADPRQPPLPASWLPKHPFDHGHMDVRDEVAVSGVWKNRDERTIRNERGREFACIENIDIQIGRVLDTLAAMGELENTWIFYTADHGMALGRHGLQGKQNLYEHTWRVPFIVKGPGVKPGSRAAGNIYLGDSLATLCDLAGIPCPETNEGTSFLPVLEGKQETVRDVLYGVYCGGQKPGIRSVRRGDWKLVKYESPSGGLHTQLFDLKDNPQELLAEHHEPAVAEVLPARPLPTQRNLAADPAHAATRAELEALLLAEMQRHDDPYRFSDQRRPPNIVLFLADDLGYGELGCYGNAAAITPNLDRFATEGLRLTDCHSASSCCSPSRSSLLTGRHPYRNGVFTWIPENSPIHLRSSEIALPKLLGQAGYDTCHVGKWHLNGMFNSPEQPQPSDHGYDWWLATQNNAAPSHAFPENFVRNGVAIGKVEDYSAPFVVREAIEWLKTKRDASKPFFLTVWTHEPHYPIASADRYEKQHAAITDPEERSYRANITQLDDAFGMLMKSLDDIGATDSTLVFFTSDNGPEGAGDTGPGRGLAGPLRGRKRSMYEGGHRVPGIIRWPGHVQPGRESGEPVIGSDFFPTAVAVAGLGPPPGRTLDGASLLPCLEGRGVDRTRPLCWRWGGFIAYREGPWKVVVDEAFKQPELFNLADDLAETTDLAAREPERLTGMLERLRALTAEIEAEGPDWWKTEPLNGRRRKPIGTAPAPAG